MPSGKARTVGSSLLWRVETGPRCTTPRQRGGLAAIGIKTGFDSFTTRQRQETAYLGLLLAHIRRAHRPFRRCAEPALPAHRDFGTFR